jgi:hypothetical protein
MMDKFEKYLQQNRMWSFEGDSGVRKFETLVHEVCGYRDLHEFLADNPGALNAMVEFVQEWVERCPEWKENLDALVEDEETVDE